MLQKGEYMVDSKKFTFSETEDFYSHLNMKILLMQIIGKQKELVKIFFLKKKKKGEYHDLHVQSNTLLVVDVFNNFQSMS